MSINATLFVQAIVFLLLVLFTMKFVWPPIAKALDERAQKIAAGLAASDKAKAELASANQRVEQELVKSRNETTTLLADAERRLSDWRFHPDGTEGFAKAEVTVGGIATDALSSKTMAARKVPGLYAVGEAVDVTGWLGGYNFQWAWASGWAAGQAISSSPRT